MERIKVLLCGSMEECKREQHRTEKVLNDARLTVKSENGFVGVPGIGGIIFMTPDHRDRVLGHRITGFEPYGTAKEHPKYEQAVELLNSRIIKQ